MVRTKDSLENINNLTKLYTLLLISEKPKHGYEIIKELEKKLEKDVSAGNIYPFLKKLVNARYVVSKDAGSRDKKIYKLTTEGRSFVSSLIGRLDNLIELSVSPKLTECAHCGCRVYKGGYKKVIKSKAFTFCCTYCAGSFK